MLVGLRQSKATKPTTLVGLRHGEARKGGALCDGKPDRYGRLSFWRFFRADGGFSGVVKTPTRAYKEAKPPGGGL